MDTTLTQTQLRGGTKGQAFNDAEIALGSWPTPSEVQAAAYKTTIKKIEIIHGSVVDGIAVTYANGTRVPHGTTGNPNTTVNISDNEIILSVFGRGGYLERGFDADLVISIGFFIINPSTFAVRVEGPFGNSGGQGVPGHLYQASCPLAFGGFATNGPNPRGLSGIGFIKSSDAA